MSTSPPPESHSHALGEASSAAHASHTAVHDLHLQTASAATHPAPAASDRLSPAADLHAPAGHDGHHTAAASHAHSHLAPHSSGDHQYHGAGHIEHLAAGHYVAPGDHQYHGAGHIAGPGEHLAAGHNVATGELLAPTQRTHSPSARAHSPSARAHSPSARAHSPATLVANFSGHAASSHASQPLLAASHTAPHNTSAHPHDTSAHMDIDPSPGLVPAPAHSAPMAAIPALHSYVPSAISTYSNSSVTSFPIGADGNPIYPTYNSASAFAAGVPGGIYQFSADSTPVHPPMNTRGRRGYEDEPRAPLPELKPEETYGATGVVTELLLRHGVENFIRECGGFPRRLDNDIFGSVLKDKIAETVAFANRVYPIIDASVRTLIEEFLQDRIKNGYDPEKSFYPGMTVNQFIHRLLIKRPLAFVGEGDSYKLRSGQTGYGTFESIHYTEHGIKLADYISYLEMPIAALIGVSTPVHFINSGSRHNYGRADSADNHEPTGIYVGLVGARFEKKGRMEWEHMLITREQNIAERGYGLNATPNEELAVWARFYEQPTDPTSKLAYFPSYAEAERDAPAHPERYLNIKTYQEEYYLNIRVYKLRMLKSLQPFFLDADVRAGALGKFAYTHVVGLGLGVWQLAGEQARYFVDVVAAIIKANKLPHVAVVDFSWFPREVVSCGDVPSGGTLHDADGHPITIMFSKRDPAEKLSDPQHLLVAMYAWDSNAFPGNEYWQGSLSASGDPAAACCSTIPYLQNPYINPALNGDRAAFLEGKAEIPEPQAEPAPSL
eukprot:m.234127 g.234127  ORF g.234127 m.234127 type:complete len:781 (-) comp12613_c0_seq1:77-2419(-)